MQRNWCSSRRSASYARTDVSARGTRSWHPPSWCCGRTLGTIRNVMLHERQFRHRSAITSLAAAGRNFNRILAGFETTLVTSRRLLPFRVGHHFRTMTEAVKKGSHPKSSNQEGQSLRCGTHGVSKPSRPRRAARVLTWIGYAPGKERRGTDPLQRACTKSGPELAVAAELDRHRASERMSAGIDQRSTGSFFIPRCPETI